MPYDVRSTPLSRGPAGDNTPPPTSATVLDFICLFTHDLRRKQKRWQDGKLKFHTFNKRFMVYDDRGNFIGDGHWQQQQQAEGGDGDFEEGLELELDRGAAIVQVAECTGSREQDLSEILDKRAREVEKRRASAAARTPAQSARSVRQDVGGGARLHFQQMQRPLSEIVPSPGPIGPAAVSDRSPYEARRDAGAGPGEQPRAPPAKRRKVDVSPPSKAGHAQNLFGTKLTLTACSVPYSTFRSKPVRDRTNVRPEMQKIRSQNEQGERDKERDVVMVESSPPEPVESGEHTSPVPRAITRPKSPLRDRSKPLGKSLLKDLSRAKTLVKQAVGKDDRIASPRDAEDDEEDEDVLVAERTPSPQRATKPRKPVTSIPRTMANTKTASLKGSSRIVEDAPKDDIQPTRKEKQRPHTSTRDSADAGNKNPDKDKGGELNSEQDQPSASVSRKGNGQATRKRAEPDRDGASASSKQKDRGEVNHGPKEDGTPDSVPPKSTEQRTELRIKPRQRRGLLMVAEKKKNPPQTAERCSEPVASQRRDDEDDSQKLGAGTNQENEAENASETAKDPTPPNNSRTSHDESSDESPSPVRDRARRKQKKGGTGDVSKEEAHDSRPSKMRGTNPRGASVTIVSDDESDRPREESCGARSRGTSKLVPSDDESDHSSSSEDMPDTFSAASKTRRSTRQKDAKGGQCSDSGPRITKMARKSVKCKEIFGFVVPDDDLVPASMASATCRIGTKTDTTVSSIVKASEMVESTEIAGVSDGAGNEEAESRAKPRIANPATRGKKAARKEDAAGKVPQCIVPFDPVVVMKPRPNIIQNKATTGNVASNVAGKSGDGGSMLGFSKANGGAWSRHAEDLLGTARPGGKTQSG